MLTLDALPWLFRKLTRPVIAVSPGFTSSTSVVQPPPSAYCVRTKPVDGADVTSTTGRVVSTNSLRSFVRPRRAITEIGVDDENVMAPRKPGPALNGT